MKKCPKCMKIYDDSWGICLLCGDRLLSADRKDLDEYRNYDKIIKCDKCGKGMPESKAIKYLSDFRKGRGPIYKHVCKECSDKIGIRKYLMTMLIVFVLAIPAVLLIIAYIVDRNLFNQMLISTSRYRLP